MAGISFYIPDRDEEDHDKYFIKKGDTIKSVAEELGKEWQVLRIYHNNHCIADADVINADFPSHLKFLLLKPIKLQANGEPEEVPLKKAVLGSGFRVPFHHVRGKNKYGVIYTVENGEQVHTLKYEVSVNWVATDKNGYSFFEIDRLSKVYINDVEADTIADELAEKTSSVLYPLEVVVDQEGEWIDIHNLEAIKQRWETKESEILEAYPGEETEKYLAHYAKNLKSNQTLAAVLSNDWFIRSFFNGIHTEYTKKLTFEGYTYFPFIAKSDDLIFNIEQKIDEYLDENDLLNIDLKGVLDDAPMKTDLEYELDLPIHSLSDQKVVGSYRAKYFLNPNNYTIQTLFIECAIALDIPQKYTVMVSNLNEKENQSLVTNSLFVDEIKKEDSFFKMFGDILRGK
ncbi:hypothetical protein FNW52_19490 [Flavobacterium sp. ZT3R18]|uniref:hypothetical protein n=1 Tax=Flavobacterium sp. ZT3R18 TaxID=2594429 RepID=UPI00117A1F8C|nr:hypothetical protein [Flavobacterium sp. ZT3R18]TRX30899.1 hypothetical protein FNW52_19490 [Flavobacterium sp. ZT3R18]